MVASRRLFLAGLLAVLAAGCGGASSCPVAGERGVLVMPGHETVLVASDEAAHDEMARLAAAKDEAGLARLVAAGRVFPTPAGTRIRVLLAGAATVKVQLMDGPFYGKTGLVSAERVARAWSP